MPTPSSALKLGAAFDYLQLHNGGQPGNSSDDVTWNVAVYGNLQTTDKLSFNLRAEYLDDSQAGIVYGQGQKAEEITFTTQYNLWANVLSRVEFRWDHYGIDAFGYSQGKAGTGNIMKKNDFLLALNLIYQF